MTTRVARPNPPPSRAIGAAATSSSVKPPVKRTTTRLVAGSSKPKVNGNDLADDLNRVLKVTQPKAARLRSVSGTATTKVPSQQPLRANKAATINGVRSLAPSADIPLNKGKQKVERDAKPTIEDELPWASSKGDVRPTDRARAAMVAINASLKILNEAIQSGFKAGSTSHSRDTTVRVERNVEIVETAMRVLRELENGGKMGSQNGQISKAGQAITSRIISLGMVSPRVLVSSHCPKLRNNGLCADWMQFDQALEQLKLARLEIIQQYDHVHDSKPPNGASNAASSSTSAADDKFEDQIQLLDLPVPRNYAELSEATRMLLCQYSIHTRVSLLAIGAINTEVRSASYSRSAD